MTNVLTPTQAANFIRAESDNMVMLQLLPMVDQYLLNATGHDWAADSSIHPSAILAAGMLLTSWYDNPALIGQAPAAIAATLVQLEAQAVKYRKYCFYGNSQSGGASVPGAMIGDQVIKLIGVYGVSDSQASKFEAIVTVQDQIQQTDGSDLSDNQYVVVLKHPAEDVNA